jgi:hypothetical protein
MILTPRPVRMTDLTWDKRTQTFSVEASTIGQPERVYDDAADVGYTLVSQATGREIVFAQSDTYRDQEGEVLSWRYEPLPEQCKSQTEANISLVVFND